MKSEMLSEKIVKPLKNKEKESQPIYANLKPSLISSLNLSSFF